MLIEMLKKRFLTFDMAAFDQIRLLHLQKYLICNLFILKRIKFCQTKKKKDMLDLENRKQSFTDAFEYRCSWKFRKFLRKKSVLESLL